MSTRLKSRLDRVELPKGGVALLCAAILALPAALALGHSAKLDSQGRWVHHHTTEYTTCNHIDQHADLNLQAGNARNNWGWNDGNPPTLLRFPPQADCHPGSGDQVHIQLQDGYMGNTGWRASSIDDPNDWNSGYHAGHTHIHFNLDASWNNYTSYDRRALVCKELGEVIGVNTVAPASWPAHGQANDCMSFAGAPNNQTSKNENANNYTYTDRVVSGGHSADLVDEKYGAEGPGLELSGALAVAADETEILDEPAYELNLSATGSAHAPARVDHLNVRVNEETVWEHDCQAVAQCSRTWTFVPSEIGLAVGSHEITVNATDAAGFTTSETLVGYLPDLSGAGELDLATYIEQPLAGGGATRINVASGNALFSAADFSAADGMSTASITRFYNSAHAQQGGAFGPGWRIGLGEDVRLTSGGQGSLVWHTPSGAKALFVATGPCSFKSAGGTSSELTAIPAQGGDPLHYELFVPEWDETWIFDADGVLTEIRSPTGPLHLTYDSHGLLTTLTFEDGSAPISIERTGSGLISEMIRQGQSIATYSYTSGRLATHTASGGATTTFSYNGSGVLAGIVKSGGPSTDVNIVQGRTASYQDTSGQTEDLSFAYEAGEDPQDLNVTEVVEGDTTTNYLVEDSGTVDAAATGSGAPVITALDTSLPSDPDEPIAPNDGISMEIAASDPSGVEWLGVVVDGSMDLEIQDPCIAPPCTTVDEAVVLDSTELLPGEYAGQVVVVDSAGNTTQQDFEFSVAPPGGCDPPEDEWDAPTPRTPTQADLEYATEFRASHDLQPTASIEDTYADPSMVDAEIRWGLPLTRAEETELEFRSNEMADAMAAIETYGNGQSSYAGMNIDQEQGGLATAMFTSDIPSHESALASAFAYPERLAVVQVSHSINELEGLQDEIESDTPALRAEHVKVEDTTVESSENRVAVHIATPTPTGPDSDLLALSEAQTVLEAEYGAGVRAETVEREALKRRFRGGHEIFLGYRDPNGVFITENRCTSGFGARFPHPQFIGPVRRRSWGVLTAGHCHENLSGIPGSTPRWYYSAGGCGVECPIGTKLFRSHSVDAMYIRISTGAKRRVPRAIYTGLGNNLRVGSVKTSKPVDGSDICVFIESYDRAHCGHVEDNDFDPVDDDYGTDDTQVKGKISRCCGERGDSGGPVYRPAHGVAVALGTLAGKVTYIPLRRRPVYEPIYHIESVLNVKVVHD